MSNSISFVGRLGKDAELKHVGEHTVVEFSLANDQGYGDKKTTAWFRCSLWRQEKLAPYLTKGKQVWVSGELTLREYDAKDGTKKTSAEVRVSAIDLVGGKGDGQAEQPASKPAATQPMPTTGPDEDSPF